MSLQQVIEEKQRNNDIGAAKCSKLLIQAYRDYLSNERLADQMVCMDGSIKRETYVFARYLSKEYAKNWECRLRRINTSVIEEAVNHRWNPHNIKATCDDEICSAMKFKLGPGTTST